MVNKPPTLCPQTLVHYPPYLITWRSQPTTHRDTVAPMREHSGPPHDNSSTPPQAVFVRNKTHNPPPRLTGYPCCLCHNLAKLYISLDKSTDHAELSRICVVSLRPPINKEIQFHIYNTLPNFTQMWSRDLGIEISLEQWHTSFTHTQIMYLQVYTREELQTSISVVQGSSHGTQNVSQYFRCFLVLSQRKRLLSPCVVGMRPSSPFLEPGF